MAYSGQFTCARRASKSISPHRANPLRTISKESLRSDSIVTFPPPQASVGDFDSTPKE